MVVRFGFQQDLAASRQDACPHAFDQIERLLGLHSRTQSGGPCRVGHALGDGRGQTVGKCVEGPVSAIGQRYAVRRDMDILRAGAHLGRETAEAIGQSADGAGRIGQRFNDNAIAACGLGIDEPVPAILLDPQTEALAARIVDNCTVRMVQQVYGDGRVAFVGGHGDHVRILPGGGQRLAHAPDGHGNRQDAVGVRFQDHRVSGHQIGKDRRIGIPQREGCAAHDHGDAPPAGPVLLVQGDSSRPPEGLAPVGLNRNVAQRLVGIGQRFHAAIQRIGAAARERHQIGLTGSVHGRMGVGKNLLFHGEGKLEAHTRPFLRA